MRTSALLFLLISFSFCRVSAQDELLKNDSLLRLLKTKYAAVSRDRVDISMELINRHLPTLSIFDSLKNIIINEAETSRNRVLMCYVYNKVAQAYLNYFNMHQYLVKAKTYIDDCSSIANENNLDNYKVASLIQYAEYYRNNSEKQKALDYNNQAIALATAIGSDSLLFESYSSIANTWNILANKLSRFQSLLNARQFAEKSREHNLMTRSYLDIATFYKENEQYEKCKDYYSLAINNGKEWNQWGAVLNGMRGMGQTYAKENKKDLVVGWYNQALALADSLGLEV